MSVAINRNMLCHLPRSVCLLIITLITSLGGTAMAFKTELVKVESLALEHYLPVQEIKDKKLLFFHSSGHGS